MELVTTLYVKQIFKLNGSLPDNLESCSWIRSQVSNLTSLTRRRNKAI